jgi:xanthine dehydrogenase YagS FAD-binding subunit
VNDFAYVAAGSVQEALRVLEQSRDAHLIAGGTDLLPLMKQGVVEPSTLVDISRWREGRYIRVHGAGLSIGALTPLSELATHDVILRSYRALAEACRLAATPQLRNMGTIGGNLLQQSRCWYYRGPYMCWLKGGDRCYAREGENEYHSIFATEPEVSQCVSAHPSDPAAALLALGAHVKVSMLHGEVDLPLEALYALPTPDRRSFVTLPEHAVLTEVTLPPVGDNQRSTYVKAMARATWAFALAGVAVWMDLSGGTVRQARIALAGVAPIPVRAARAEALLLGSSPAEWDYGRLGKALVEGARPLAHNRYKITLLQGIFKQALEQLLA